MFERYFGPGYKAYIPGALLVVVQLVLVAVGWFVVEDRLIAQGLVFISLLIAIMAVVLIAGAIRRDRYRRGDTR